MQQSKQQGSTGSRPSLLSGTKSEAGASGRILTTLADGPDLVKPARATRWRAALLAMLLTILGVGASAFWYVGHAPVASQAELGAAPSTVSAPAAMAMAMATATAAQDTAATQPALPAVTRTEAAATIIGDGAGPGRAGATEVHAVIDAAHTDRHRHKPAAPTEHKLALRRDTSKTLKQAARVAKHGSPSLAHAEPRKSRLAAVAHARKKQAPVLVKEAPPVVDPVARQMDGDVNLLSALVSHATEHDQTAASKVTGAAPASSKK